MLSASDLAGIAVLGVVGLAIAVVLALVIGRNLFLRDPTAGRPRASASPSRAVVATVPAAPVVPRGTLTGTPYAGKLAAAHVTRPRASCGQHGLRTTTGRRADFQGAQALDGKLSTAWRCAGSGVGRTLTVDLPGSPQVAAVALVPGFADTDPITGADGFATDRRVVRVQWSLAGKTVVQTLDPGQEVLQRLRIPATRAARVTLTILATTTARNDVFAVSEIALYTVR